MTEPTTTTAPTESEWTASRESAGALRLGAGLWLLAYLLYLASTIGNRLLFSSHDYPFNWKSIPYAMDAPRIFDATSQIYFWLRSWIIERVFIIACFTAAIFWAVSCGLIGSVRRTDMDRRLANAVKFGGFALLIFALGWHIASIPFYRLMFARRALNMIEAVEPALGLLVVLHLRGLLRHTSDRLLRAMLDPLLWATLANTAVYVLLAMARDGIGNAIDVVMMIARAATGVCFVIVMLQLWTSPPTDLLSGSGVAAATPDDAAGT